MTKDTKANPDLVHQVYQTPRITDKIYRHDGAIDMKGLKAALQWVADAGKIPAAKLPSPDDLVLPAGMGGRVR